jgi:hypothetical protein
MCGIFIAKKEGFLFLRQGMKEVYKRYHLYRQSQMRALCP